MEFNFDISKIKQDENFIRNNMYKQGNEKDPMNTNPYFDLVEITEDVWTNICVAIMKIKEDKTLYFPKARTHLRKKISRSWSDITTMAQDNKIEEYFGDNSDYVFVAGGSALATLLTVQSSDVDYFSTKEINPSEIKTNFSTFQVTPHVVNFDTKRQLIKRLYKMPHEIIHSFDIDCCSVLINKEGKIYGTKRFIYALINGCNIVDFEYFSPSYEWRLIKYSNRGFSVYIPNVVNCPDPESLYTESVNGMCFPDSLWAFADIDDMLEGTMLSALLMNAKGIEKIMLASSVASPHTKDELEGTSTSAMRKLRKLAATQMSDYEEPIEEGNEVRGKITLNNKVYYINGKISYDENGIPNSYKGLFYSEDDINKMRKSDDVREFSQELGTKIINIFNSPYRIVNPGEQTTSTYHRVVMDDYNEWFKLDTATLFIDALYTMLYFKRVSNPPALYDEKVKWFNKLNTDGKDIINSFIYHFARLEFNNRLYDKFNGIEITQIKVGYGKYIPKSIIYMNSEYPIPNGDKQGIYSVLLQLDNIFTQREYDLLQALHIRSGGNFSQDTRTLSNKNITSVVPKIDTRY